MAPGRSRGLTKRAGFWHSHAIPPQLRIYSRSLPILALSGSVVGFCKTVILSCCSVLYSQFSMGLGQCGWILEFVSKRSAGLDDSVDLRPPSMSSFPTLFSGATYFCLPFYLSP